MNCSQPNRMNLFNKKIGSNLLAWETRPLILLFAVLQQLNIRLPARLLHVQRPQARLHLAHMRLAQ